MIRLLTLLGYHDRKYRGDGFTVRIRPVFREVVHIIHTRRGTTLKLNGERIGRKWEGIGARIPPEVDAVNIRQIVSDLQIAFAAMGYKYVIDHKVAIEIVPETEKQAALTALREMGFEIEVSPDGKQVRQTWQRGVQRPDKETARLMGPRMMSLLQAVSGIRSRIEVLAQSEDL
jgi:hypothetical protein